MADLSVTAANVAVGGTGAATFIKQFGETMTAGQSTYENTTDGKWYKADANTSSTTSQAKGIVLVGAAGDAYGVILYYGPITIGATVTLGVPYIVSTTAGGIAPASDFAGYSSTVYLTHLGYATSTTVIDVRPAQNLVSK